MVSTSTRVAWVALLVGSLVGCSDCSEPDPGGDLTAPTFENIRVTPARAGEGDTVTLTFDASEALEPGTDALPNPKVTLAETPVGCASTDGRAWVCTLVVDASLPEGEHHFELAGVDAAGNLGGPVQSEPGVVLDFTPPALVVVIQDVARPGRPLAVTVVSTGEDLVAVPTLAADFSSGTPNCVGDVPGERFDCAVAVDPAATLGVHVLTVQGKDEVGNTGARDAEVEVTDPVPRLTVDSLGPDPARGGVTVDLTYSSDVPLDQCGATVGGAAGLCTQPTATRCACTSPVPSSAPDGPTAVQLRGTNASGTGVLDTVLMVDAVRPILDPSAVHLIRTPLGQDDAIVLDAGAATDGGFDYPGRQVVGYAVWADELATVPMLTLVPEADGGVSQTALPGTDGTTVDTLAPGSIHVTALDAAGNVSVRVPPGDGVDLVDPVVAPDAVVLEAGSTNSVVAQAGGLTDAYSAVARLHVFAGVTDAVPIVTGTPNPDGSLDLLDVGVLTGSPESRRVFLELEDKTGARSPRTPTTLVRVPVDPATKVAYSPSLPDLRVHPIVRSTQATGFHPGHLVELAGETDPARVDAATGAGVLVTASPTPVSPRLELVTPPMLAEAALFYDTTLDRPVTIGGTAGAMPLGEGRYEPWEHRPDRGAPLGISRPLVADLGSGARVLWGGAVPSNIAGYTQPNPDTWYDDPATGWEVLSSYTWPRSKDQVTAVAFDPNRGVLVWWSRAGSSGFYEWDAATGVWTRIDRGNSWPLTYLRHLVWHPGLGALVGWEPGTSTVGRLWRYDPGAGWSSSLRQGPTLNVAMGYAWDPVNAVLVLVNGNGTWELDNAGAGWTALGIPLGVKVGGAVYDPLTARVLAWAGPDIYALDRTSSSWIFLGSAPRDIDTMVYEPVRGYVVGQACSPDGTACDAFSILGSYTPGGDALPADNVRYLTHGGELYAYGGVIGIHDETKLWQWTASGWIDLTPGPVDSWGMLTPIGNGKAMLFDGETWVFENKTWTRQGGPQPPDRRDARTAWDPVRGEVVMFGGFDGAYRGDTWVWDGTGWTLRAPATSPSSRSRGAMAWHGGANGVVLYGGLDWGTIGFEEAWLWDGNTWSQFPIDPAMGPNLDSPMIWHAARGELQAWLDGGQIWSHDGSGWSHTGQLTPELVSPRVYTDPRDGAVVLMVAAGGEVELYRWKNGGWTYDAYGSPGDPAAPGARATPAWDPVHGRAIAFGGDAAFGDGVTWAFDGAAWSALTATFPVEGVRAPGLRYDPASGMMLMTGGTFASGANPTDAFVLAGSEWVPNANHPALAAALPDLIYDGTSGRHQAVDRTDRSFWVESATGWTQYTGIPAPTGGSPGVWSGALGTAVTLSVDGSGLLEFDGAGWTASALPSPPLAGRESLAPHPDGEKLLLVGDGTWTIDPAAGPERWAGVVVALAINGATEVDLVFEVSGDSAMTSGAELYLWDPTLEVWTQVDSHSEVPPTSGTLTWRGAPGPYVSAGAVWALVQPAGPSGGALGGPAATLELLRVSGSILMQTTLP